MRENGGGVAWTTIECVILDMDGTLLDLHFDNQLWNELLPRRFAENQGLLLAQARAQIRHRLEGQRGTLPWYCLDHWSRTFGVVLPGLEAELEHLIRPRPGALAFLDWMVARHIPLVLATNAHPASLSRKLAATGIAAKFRDIVSAHDLGASKESPQFWDALSQRVGFVPAHTLFIDDNAHVRQSARAWGVGHIYGIARPDSRGPRVDADDCHCLEDFAELTGNALQARG